MRPSTVLACWTLFVWGTRLRSGLALLPLAFVALAVAVLLRRRDRTTALVLAGATAAAWVVRGVDLAVLSDHDAAFVAVHLALATVSIGLAAWVVADLRRRPVAQPATR